VFGVLVQFGCDAYDETLLTAHRARGSNAGRTGSAAKGDAASAEEFDAAAAIDEDIGKPGTSRDAGHKSDSAVSIRDASAEEGETDDGGSEVGSGGRAGGAGGASGSSAGGTSGSSAGSGGSSPAPCADANGRAWGDNGHCYFPLSVMNSWYVSRDRCSELGAHLVSITSAEEQTFVNGLVGSSARWIGLARFGAPAFSWVDGAVMTYENWENGAPTLATEAAAAVRSDTFLWFDDQVSQVHGAICERQ
jgi:hypothetical protein